MCHLFICVLLFTSCLEKPSTQQLMLFMTFWTLLDLFLYYYDCLTGPDPFIVPGNGRNNIWILKLQTSGCCCYFRHWNRLKLLKSGILAKADEEMSMQTLVKESKGFIKICQHDGMIFKVPVDEILCWCYSLFFPF